MHCEPNVRDHLHQAKEALHAAQAVAGTHMRHALRHMLHAGLAAMDAADAKCARQHPTAAPQPSHQPTAETPPPTT